MSTPTTESSLSSVEEGVPATPASIDRPASLGNRGRCLSLTSKAYDIDGDGKLDDAEKAMRDMDKEGLGYLTNDKVYTIFKEQLNMQKQLLVAKRLIISCAGLLVLLAVANVGVAFAAANLAKDTATNNNVLVVKDSGEVVATNNHADVFGVNTSLDTSRRTQAVADGTTTAQEQTTISEADAQAMLSDCQSGGSAQITRSWATVPGLSVSIPVCPGGTFSVNLGPSGKRYRFTLSDSRNINIRCPQDSEMCVMLGNGIQQEPGESCVYDADCLYSATCVGVDTSTGTPGSCVLPFQGSGCHFANGGSDCETDFCFAGGFSPPIYGYCSCHPTTNSGCSSPRECYTGDEQGYPDSGPSCLLPVGGSGCSQDFDCVGPTVGCVSGVCTQQ